MFASNSEDGLREREVRERSRETEKEVVEYSAFMSFSPSPMYLFITVEALMLKNLNPDSVATALAIIVFPVPGGP
jgi:hypothetical protein